MDDNQNDTKIFVEELYKYLLHRSPNPGELESWTASIGSGLNDRDAFRRFTTSSEFLKRMPQDAPRMEFPAGHFYSPIVDPKQVREYHNAASRLKPEELSGIELPSKEMIEFWRANLSLFQQTPFTNEPSKQNRYFYDAGHYPHGDAIMLRAMIAAKHPKRIIEIGSGFSTAVMLDTIDQFGLRDIKITCIEPYPERLFSIMRPLDEENLRIIQSGVQSVDVDVFRELEAGDILFIDSTHVLKTGSDVHYELFSILPVLKPGVLVHFHDCQYPFEYPSSWIFQRNFSWNEIYAVRALLSYSNRYQVEFWNGLFAYLYEDEIRRDLPTFLVNPGGAIWIKVL